MPEALKKIYLGDGAYCEFDGFQLRLWAPRETGDHEVFLEPEAVEALLKFIGKCWNVEIKVNKIGEAEDIKVTPSEDPAFEAGVV